MVWVNNMIDDGMATTIHWHGLTQTDTNFMDGVPRLTQCNIHPFETFKLVFTTSFYSTLRCILRLASYVEKCVLLKWDILRIERFLMTLQTDSSIIWFATKLVCLCTGSDQYNVSKLSGRAIQRPGFDPRLRPTNFSCFIISNLPYFLLWKQCLK